MPIQEIKGLQGLKGWGELTQQERDEWLVAHPKYQGLSYSKTANGYANQNFIDAFGLPAFKSMSRADRDALYKEKVLNDAVKENFFDLCQDNKYLMSVNTPHIVFNFLFHKRLFPHKNNSRGTTQTSSP